MAYKQLTDFKSTSARTRANFHEKKNTVQLNMLKFLAVKFHGKKKLYILICVYVRVCVLDCL